MTYEPLNPEILTRSLKTTRLGKPITCYDQVASTNVIALEMAHSGCPEGAVVVADSQTHGKGRLGRSWDSPTGKNLYLSLVLRPELDPTEAAKLTLLAAVSVAETIHPLLNFAPRIKWPNDVLLHGRKTAGILCELVTERKNARFVIVGLGVNLNYPRDAMPPQIRDIATSVMEESGREVDRALFTRALIENLEKHYLGLRACGFTAVARSWNQYARIEGQWMRAQVNGGSIIGKAVGLDENGFLVLESTKGTTETVIAGDVALLDASPRTTGATTLGMNQEKGAQIPDKACC